MKDFQPYAHSAHEYKRDKRFTKQQIDVKLNKNKTFTINDIKGFVNKVYTDKKDVSHYKDDVKVMVRALTEVGERTLKGYSNDINDMNKTIDDYLKSAVLDSTKFKHVYSLSITAIY